MPESPPPLPKTTLAWLRQSAAVDGAAYSQVLLHILERLEALERRPIPGTVELAAPTPEAAPVATDEELCSAYINVPEHNFGPAIRAVYNLGRKHGAGAAQPAPPVAPAGGLVDEICRQLPLRPVEIRAVIRLVAAWLSERGYRAAPADLLEQEEGR